MRVLFFCVCAAIYWDDGSDHTRCRDRHLLSHNISSLYYLRKVRKLFSILPMIYLSKLSILWLVYREVNNIKGQDVLTGPIDDIFLHKFLRNVMFIVNEKRVEFCSHCLWFFVKWYGFSDIFSGKDESLTHSNPANHYFIIVFIFFCQFLQLEVSVVEVHYILEALLADRCKIFWWF